MHVSGSSLTPSRRLAVALISALLPVLAFSAAAGADPTFCSTGTTVWNGGSGLWSDASWSNGQPSSTCDASIPSGNVTLTTTVDHYGNEDSASVLGLTLGSGATLTVQGESSDVQGNWYNATNLGIGNDGLSIAAGAVLSLEASAASNTTPVSGETAGGGAYLIMSTGRSVPFANNGTINASTSDGAYGEYMQFGADLINTGTINVQSGTLGLDGTSPLIINNNGAVNVASGARIAMSAGDGSSFTNKGTYSDQGATTMAGTMHFIQNGGTESGSPIQLTGQETLEDSAGAGSFESINGCGGGSVVTGTIPAGQTITVQGATNNCSGNEGQQTALGLGASTSQTVVNNGTIVLSASGSGTSSGGSAQLDGGTLDNHGTVDATVTDSNYSTTILSPLINESGGTINLSGGKLYQTAGTATVNSGNVTVEPGSTWIVQGGSFTNKGTLTMPIIGAAGFGSFTMTAGGVFNAGGTLAPTLKSYKPPSGKEFQLFTIGGFSGKFRTVTNGFRADYSKEKASTPFVGVIYGGAASAGKRPSIAKPAGGARKVTDKLSCSKGKACEKVMLIALDGKATVATGSGTAKPGKSVTLTAKLNRAGLKLLSRHGRLRVRVELRAGGATLKTATVTVTKR